MSFYVVLCREYLLIKLCRIVVCGYLFMDQQRQKQYMKKYLSTPKGKAARKRAQNRYNQSRKGRLARARYFKTLKGKEAVADYKRRLQFIR